MLKRSGLVWAVAWVLFGGCGRPPAPPPEPPRGDVVPRHWDQVCTDGPAVPRTVRLGELLDTVGLADSLAHRGVHPLPLVRPWPLYSFIARFDARGRPVAMGTWEATVDSAIALALEEEIQRRVRRLPPLLEASGFRIRVRYARTIDVGIAEPVECMPHMVHRVGEPPTGLPDGVRTWGGSSFVREGDANTAAVRIHVGADGKVTAVDSVRGLSETIRRTREVVGLLSFDPALSNGVPVPGLLLQAFRFNRPPT